jgi:hypothetical protein
MRGAIVVAQDERKTFLGRITSRRERESIFNVTGRYGDPTSASSIWNPQSTLGNQFNVNSPFNQFSGSPPLILKDRKVIGYLSTNAGLRFAIAPQALKTLCKDEL